MSAHEQRFSGDIRRLEVDAGDGDLEVRWSSRDDVVVSGDAVEVEEDGDTLAITRTSSRGLLGIFSSPTLRLELPETVAEARLRVRSGDLELQQARGGVEARVDHGDFEVRGGRGELAVKLGAGDVKADGYAGPIAVQSGAGDVSMTGVAGPVAIHSGAGDVTVRGDHGDVAVKNGRGDVTIRDRACENAEVKTGAGDVTLSGGSIGSTSIQTGKGDISASTSPGPGEHDFTTGAGDVTLAVPRGLVARIDLTTVRGSISSEVPLVAVGKRGPKSMLGRRLVGGIGEGSRRAEIRVRSVLGDVRLKWLDGAGVTPAASTPTWSNAPEGVDTNAEVDVDVVSDLDVTPPATTPVPAPASSGAGEERAILSALAAGTISVAEAERLLDALARRGS